MKTPHIPTAQSGDVDVFTSALTALRVGGIDFEVVAEFSVGTEETGHVDRAA